MKMLLTMSVLLLLFAVHAQAQTCSKVGTYTYCDTDQGSVIVAPQGDRYGVILGPGTNLDTYSTLGEGNSRKTYIDPGVMPTPREEKASRPSYRYTPPSSLYGPSPGEMGVLE